MSPPGKSGRDPRRGVILTRRYLDKRAPLVTSLGVMDPRARWVPDRATLDPAERMSVGELRELQLARLRETLEHAYANVGHYRRAFDAAGLLPRDCRELADLAKFPLTTKADLRDNLPYGMLAVPLS